MERSTSPPALTILPARPRSCPVFDEVLSFKQRKKVPKEAPQGTDGSLTSFILQELLCKTGRNLGLS